VSIRYPASLRPGDRIGVTAPSSGVGEALWPRLEVAVEVVRRHGYEVVLGECLADGGHVSAPAPQRAAELTDMLTDPAIRAVVPPWGGETAIDLLPLIDWEAVAAAEPTWLVGFSDIATLITPLTLLTGTATIHGNNLMDTPYRTPEGLVSWLDIVALPPGATFGQTSPGRYRAAAHDDYESRPDIIEMSLDALGSWSRLDAEGPVDVRGRLVGGCIETLSNLAGTPFGDVAAFAGRHAPEGLLVYVEAAEHDAYTICRNLHGMRLAGFFTGANAVLVGRTNAPDRPGLSQHEAVLDALGDLGVPIVADVECGHVAPYLPLVNGAVARVWFDGTTGQVTQTLV
jgi:muramoyltetrapeptide carboxypeptidase